MLLWRRDLTLKSSNQTFTYLNFRACNSRLQQSVGLIEGVLNPHVSQAKRISENIKGPCRNADYLVQAIGCATSTR